MNENGAAPLAFACKLICSPTHTCAIPIIEAVGGGWMVTVKLQLVLLPQSSVAVHVTVVVPAGKVVPDAGVQTTVTLVSHVSVAVTLYVIKFVQFVMLFGHVIVGRVVSRTVTVWLQLA
jgi:hypothetical protein